MIYAAERGAVTLTSSCVQVVELKSHLQSRGLRTSGLKEDLVARLKEADKCETAAPENRSNAAGAAAVPAIHTTPAPRSETGAAPHSEATEKKRPRHDAKTPTIGMKVKTLYDSFDIPRGAPQGKSALEFVKGEEITIADLKEEEGKWYAVGHLFPFQWFPLSATDWKKTSQVPDTSRKRDLFSSTDGNDGEVNGPEAKKQRMTFEAGQVSVERVLELFPLASSEVVVQCGGRQAGGAGAGSSVLTCRAGERFEVIVTLKTPFGTVPLFAERMLRELILSLVGPSSLRKIPAGHRGSSLSPETGVVSFPVELTKAAEDVEISVSFMYKDEPQMIGHGVTVKVLPGQIKFESLQAIRVPQYSPQKHQSQSSAIEVGETIKLVLGPCTKDVHGNELQQDLCEEDVSGLALTATWRCEGKMGNLRLMPPTLTGVGLGVVVGEVSLSLPGHHVFQVSCSAQQLTTTVHVECGVPQSLKMIEEGKPHVLRRWRWGGKALVLNQHGHAIRFGPLDLSVKMGLNLNDCSPSQEQAQWIHVKTRQTERSEEIQACSLSDVFVTTQSTPQPSKHGEEQRGVDDDLAEHEVEALELLGNALGEGRRHKLERRERVQGIRPVAAAVVDADLVQDRAHRFGVHAGAAHKLHARLFYLGQIVLGLGQGCDRSAPSQERHACRAGRWSGPAGPGRRDSSWRYKPCQQVGGTRRGSLKQESHQLHWMGSKVRRTPMETPGQYRLGNFCRENPLEEIAWYIKN